MKTFYIALFLLSTISVTQSQWTNQNPVPDGNHLWSTYFVDDNTGWIVGSGGFIKKTTNAGLDWFQQNSGTSQKLRSVQFINHNIGWICGESGLIIKTTDGGQNWFVLTSGITAELTDLQFYDLNIGYIVGENETILKTTNGGTNWNIQKSGSTYDLYSVDFVDTFLGYAVGGRDSIKFLKTTDGGLNWIEKKIYYYPSSSEPKLLNCVEFIDANVGWIGGDNRNGLNHSGYIGKTTDGGETWLSKTMMRPTDKQDSVNTDHETDNITDVQRGIRSIYFKDANNGYAVGGTRDGWWRKVFTTTDAGNTWQSKYGYSEQTGLLSVFVTSGGKGWAVGYYGVIYLTEDNGSTWKQILSGSQLPNGYTGDWINTIHMVDDNLGWAAGSRKGIQRYYLIMKTTNGGKIWKTNFEYDSWYKSFSYIYFKDENYGWAIAADGGGYKTTNGGQNWVTNGTIFNNVFFINQDIGWGTTGPGPRGIVKTTDGGNTWVQKSSVSSSSVYFSDINNGWAVGPNGSIVKSTDGGENWISKTSGTSTDLSKVCFYDTNIGMCLSNSGIVLVSTDGGENWISKSGPNLYELTFLNPTTIWGQTAGGQLYKTSDFGDNWSSFNVGVSGVSSFFINDNKGWVVNGNNSIFNYSTEPLLTLNSPNGGEIWKTDWTRNITWSSENVQYLNLFYSTNSGTSWNTIASNVVAASGSYAWEIPLLSPFISPHCKVKIESSSNSSAFDESDNTFSILPLHFTPIWSSNPYTPMNIYVTAATIGGVALVAGDEIGVFDGDNCVGSVVLTEPIPSGGFASIIASTDDPTTTPVDGFIPGHSITYKLWSASNSREITNVTPVYTLGNGTFSSQGSAVVSLTSIYTVTQQVAQTTGWNILSLMATPENPNMLQLLNPLITAGVLIKVQDERGFAVEQLPVIGWINNIGNWQATEGYYMKVNAPSTLSVEGVPVALPLNIPLTNGWNIIGYPVPTEQNALTVLNPLITANQLIKVQNEAGQAVEQLPVIGWINNIGNFKSGEGYYLKVNTNTSLTLSDPGDSPVKVLAVKEEEKSKNLNKPNADHFVPIYSSPYLPMNIYVTAVSLLGGGTLGAGDEIGIFDGNYCVGSITLAGPIGSFVSLIASTDDPGAAGVDGFTPGHTISYKFWLSSTLTEITTYNVEYAVGNGTFASQGTAVVSFESVLPVELTSFTANLNKTQVDLKWQTATEKNNFGFEIERKTESSWEKIGFVEGNGNSNSPKEYSYTDNKLVGGTKFQYRLKQIDSDGKYEYSAVVEVENIPTEYALYQNYPNPFNPTTSIRYQLPKESKVVIKIYSILGSEVLELLNENKEPGIYEVEFNASNLSSGTYIYKISADNFVQIKKMILLK